jgi:thioredoxin reductase (NADPH)
MSRETAGWLGWLPPEIALDARGNVLTGADVRASGRWTHDRDPYLLETSVPGIFACGDVRFGPVERVAAAVGEGSMAIAFVQQVLRGARRVSPGPAVEQRARPQTARWPGDVRSSFAEHEP